MTETTMSKTDAAAALESLADAGHLDREFKNLDARGWEVVHEDGVGWYVKETGARALLPVLRHVAYVSDWLPVEVAEQP